MMGSQGTGQIHYKYDGLYQGASAISLSRTSSYVTILSKEEKMIAGCLGLVEYSARDDHGEASGLKSLSCKIYIARDGGVYSFWAGTTSESTAELFAELEELVENARFD